MTVLGSGSIITQCADAELIDELSLMIDPVALIKGVAIFQNMVKYLQLELQHTRSFSIGVVLLNYLVKK
ncbi:MAG: dihydrofolate reductase family protein [Flavisolibacter sp.]|jgi:dihydrofolate reductase|nr:dihydrofolate reductase family protein [Flavisolibacter sp.]